MSTNSTKGLLYEWAGIGITTGKIFNNAHSVLDELALKVDADPLGFILEVLQRFPRYGGIQYNRGPSGAAPYIDRVDLTFYETRMPPPPPPPCDHREATVSSATRNLISVDCACGASWNMHQMDAKPQKWFATANRKARE